jgi:hypothetical protein
MHQKIIVSYASYPARIDAAWIVMENVLTKQTVKPDLLVLNLYEGHFPDRKLPDKYDMFIKRADVEIHWCEKDMKSYNKFLYVTKEYPNEIVILLDDDIYYPVNLIEHLLEGHKKWPEAFIASFGQLMTFEEDGTLASRRFWSAYDNETACKNQPTKWFNLGTGAGTLYIPNWITSEKFDFFDEDLISEEVPTNDESWFNIARIINERDVVLYDPLYVINKCLIEDVQQYGLFITVNNTAEEIAKHDAFVKRYSIRNSELDYYTKWLIRERDRALKLAEDHRSQYDIIILENEKLSKELSEFFSVKRCCKRLAGNILRLMIPKVKNKELKLIENQFSYTIITDDNQEVSGNNGEAIAIEHARVSAISLSISNVEKDNYGNIVCRVHLSNKGWQSRSTSPCVSGDTTGKEAIECIKLELKGNLALNYDIWYRVKRVMVLGREWLGWAKNGQPSRSTGYSRHLSGIQIMILPKGAKPPGENSNYYEERV